MTTGRPERKYESIQTGYALLLVFSQLSQAKGKAEILLTMNGSINREGHHGNSRSILQLTASLVP